MKYRSIPEANIAYLLPIAAVLVVLLLLLLLMLLLVPEISGPELNNSES